MFSVAMVGCLIASTAQLSGQCSRKTKFEELNVGESIKLTSKQSSLATKMYLRLSENPTRVVENLGGPLNSTIAHQVQASLFSTRIQLDRDFIVGFERTNADERGCVVNKGSQRTIECSANWINNPDAYLLILRYCIEQQPVIIDSDPNFRAFQERSGQFSSDDGCPEAIVQSVSEKSSQVTRYTMDEVLSSASIRELNG